MSYDTELQRYKITEKKCEIRPHRNQKDKTNRAAQRPLGSKTDKKNTHIPYSL